MSTEIKNIALFINFNSGKIKVREIKKGITLTFKEEEFEEEKSENQYVDTGFIDINKLNDENDYNRILLKLIEYAKTGSKKPKPDNRFNNVELTPLGSKIQNVSDESVPFESVPDKSVPVESVSDIKYVDDSNVPIEPVTDADANISSEKMIEGLKKSMSGGKTKNKRNKKTKNTLKIIS
jgi:hypothetical protein